MSSDFVNKIPACSACSIPLSKAAHRSSPLCIVVTWKQFSMWKKSLKIMILILYTQPWVCGFFTWSSESVEYKEYAASRGGTHLPAKLNQTTFMFDKRVKQIASTIHSVWTGFILSGLLPFFVYLSPSGPRQSAWWDHLQKTISINAKTKHSIITYIVLYIIKTNIIVYNHYLWSWYSLSSHAWCNVIFDKTFKIHRLPSVHAANMYLLWLYRSSNGLPLLLVFIAQINLLLINL